MLPLEFAVPSLDRRKAPVTSLADKSTKRRDKARTRIGPFFEDEGDADLRPDLEAGPSRRAEHPSKRPSSQPLRELSQEQQNSQPSQRSPPSKNIKGVSDVQQVENIDTSSAAAHPLATTAAVADTSQSGAAAETFQQKEVLNNAIASLLARKEAAGVRSEQLARPDSLGKRRRGPLGRAASGGSFGSNLSRRASSIGSNISQDEQRPTTPLPDPSQKIIYEDERAQEDRRALIRKMGGKVDADDEGRKRVESIGTVKDAVNAGAATVAGGRGKRKPGKK
jgi:hypothetical protein